MRIRSPAVLLALSVAACRGSPDRAGPDGGGGAGDGGAAGDGAGDDGGRGPGDIPMPTDFDLDEIEAGRHETAVQTFDEISRDGRWFAGMARGSGNSESIIFAFDLETLEVGAELPLSDLYDGTCAPDPEWGVLEPDWIGVSPLGTYLVVQWPGSRGGRCNGMETFEIETGAYAGRVTLEHPHGDLQVLADGATEVFVCSDLGGPGKGQEPLAHALMRQLSLDCRYPAASLRERICVAPEGADREVAA